MTDQGLWAVAELKCLAKHCLTGCSLVTDEGVRAVWLSPRHHTGQAWAVCTYPTHLLFAAGEELQLARRQAGGVGGRLRQFHKAGRLSACK